jgi:hypothetical protein
LAAEPWCGPGACLYPRRGGKGTAGRLAQEALRAEKAEFCTTTPSTVLLAAMGGLKPRIIFVHRLVRYLGERMPSLPSGRRRFTAWRVGYYREGP